MGRLSEKKNAKRADEGGRMRDAMKLPDVETLEALSRGEPAGPTRQLTLPLETSRRRREADATTRKEP